MGFDNECILNIQTLAGEYFCPVCRLLVYPNEALQSQCTHLYCKPCLTYVVGTTRACPYDGYLVTEADSKPLIESNKALAETIGKIAVHCLYHRSGCTWQGPLSECTSHCTGCAFGNSPVVCNRCGIQIVHRQVQEHAQNCPGVQPQAEGIAELGFRVLNRIFSLFQIISAGEYFCPVCRLLVYPNEALQSQCTHLYCKPCLTYVVGTTRACPYDGYLVTEADSKPLIESNKALAETIGTIAVHCLYHRSGCTWQGPLSECTSHCTGCAFGNSPVVCNRCGIQIVHRQVQEHAQNCPPHGQSQLHVQAPAVAQPQNQAQVNLQQQPLTAVQLHSQIQSQTQPAPSHPHPQPQPHLTQTHPQQHVPMPQYQQPHHQMQHPQLQIQQQAHQHPTSQAQPHSQAQLQAPVHPHLNPNVNQMQLPSAHAVTGHQSYPQPQPQPHQQAHPVVPQQHPMQMHPQGGFQPQTQHPGQMPSQYPQQHTTMRPTHSHGTLPNQQQVQQNLPLSHGSQNVAGRPVLPNLGVQSHPYPQHAGGVQARPIHPGASQPAANQTNILRNSNQVQVSTEQQSGVTSRPTSVGDQKGESSSENAVKKDSNDLGAGLGADAGDGKTVKSETESKDNGNAEPGSNAFENGELVMRMVKEEVTESTLEHLKGSKSGEFVIEIKKDVENSAMEDRESQDDHLLKKTPLQESEHVEKLSGKLQKDTSGIQQPDEGSQTLSTISAPVSRSPAQNVIPKGSVAHGPGVDEYRGFPPPGQVQPGGFTQPSHPGPIADQGRHFGPSTLQQRPGAPLLQTTPHALPHYPHTAGHPPTQFRPQGPGHAPEHFQPPVFKQSQGLEIPPGGISGPGSAASFGRGTGYHGFPHQNFESQSVAPQGPHSQGHALPTHAAASRLSQGESVGPPFGILAPGAIDSHGGMARAPPHGPEGLMGQQRPINPMETELFINHRPGYMDGRRPDPHLPGSLGLGPVGQPSGVMRNNGPPGLESSFTHGLRDDRFKPFPDERSNSFPAGRHVTDKGEFEDDLKQFPRPSRLDAEPLPKFGSYSSRPHDMGPHGPNYDTGLKLDPGAGGARSRFLPPFDRGDRPVGLPDSSNIHPDFLGPVTGYGRRHMDGLAPRSPVREYSGISSHGFGGLPGQLGPDDFDGSESRRFGDPIGKSFHESRFPILPSHLHRGEFEGPGKMRMSEHLRSGELIGLDGHLRRGEHMGPQNMPSHLRLGEPIGFGDYPGHPRMGELAGLGNFEPFGAGNRASHPRFGESGFRSSFPRQGFPNDAGIDTGEMESFGNLRKRKAASMGWCRICKVDCETVEGLELHSQTREHQKMAMDMVRSIKQNAKKQKQTSGDNSSLEDASKSRNTSFEGRGNNH
ncbi:hypothetical protein CFP56_002422 [Quercus suber]|uniref:RING-type domain-containing protein n=1 Tax=Quercus suber TaxID=58331 RepID=A0AAW0LH41_QUESU